MATDLSEEKMVSTKIALIKVNGEICRLYLFTYDEIVIYFNKA